MQCWECCLNPLFPLQASLEANTVEGLTERKYYFETGGINLQLN
uniref:Uncharacterized protein n=1 Tax=Arundo donax TaxID=35708 RepID=A0A0A9CMZ0_ARUDO